MSAPNEVSATQQSSAAMTSCAIHFAVSRSSWTGGGMVPAAAAALRARMYKIATASASGAPADLTESCTSPSMADRAGRFDAASMRLGRQPAGLITVLLRRRGGDEADASALTGHRPEAETRQPAEPAADVAPSSFSSDAAVSRAAGTGQQRPSPRRQRQLLLTRLTTLRSRLSVARQIRQPADSVSPAGGTCGS